MVSSLRQFEERCRSLYPALYRKVWWIVGDRDLAEDVLQEAMVKAYQALGQLRDWEHFEGWLYRIAVREGMAAAKARRVRWGRRAEVDENLISEESDPAAEVEWEEERRAIWRQLEGLSARQRTAFVLCAVEERSIREAADCIDISEGAVKRHLGRAREKLRKGLGRYLGR